MINVDFDMLVLRKRYQQYTLDKLYKEKTKVNQKLQPILSGLDKKKDGAWWGELARAMYLNTVLGVILDVIKNKIRESSSN